MHVIVNNTLYEHEDPVMLLISYVEDYSLIMPIARLTEEEALDLSSDGVLRFVLESNNKKLCIKYDNFLSDTVDMCNDYSTLLKSLETSALQSAHRAIHNVSRLAALSARTFISHYADKQPIKKDIQVEWWIPAAHHAFACYEVFYFLLHGEEPDYKATRPSTHLGVPTTHARKYLDVQLQPNLSTSFFGVN